MKPELSLDTGKGMRQARLSLGLTQDQLAARLGVAPNTVARWERGERRIHPTAARLLETILSRSRRRS